MSACITRKLGAINRFSASLQEDREYVVLCADGEGRKMLNQLETWMADRVVGAPQTHFEVSKITIDQYMSGWDSLLFKLNWDLVSAVSGPANLEGILEKLIACLPIWNVRQKLGHPMEPRRELWGRMTHLLTTQRLIT